MLRIPSPFEILKDFDNEEVEMFNQAMKEHQAEERERIADEVMEERRIRKQNATDASVDQAVEEHQFGRDDRDMSE